MTLWNGAGQELASANGSYLHARVFAAPDELRVALGPAGNDLIQKISATTGAASTSSYQGAFHAWFVDGTRFLTKAATTVRVYATASVTQQSIFTLPSVENLTGQGDYVWTHRAHTPGYPLDIYALSNPSAPAASFALRGSARLFASGSTIGVINPSFLEVELVQLGASITKSTVVGTASASAYGADASGAWAVGGALGEIFDGAELESSLSCGQVRSITGTDDGTLAVATAAGGILLFDAAGSQPEYVARIPFHSSHLALSDDGGVLAAISPVSDLGDDRTLRVFELPARTELKVWTYGWRDLVDFAMSSQGDRFGLVTRAGIPPTYTQSVVDLDDNSYLDVSPSGDAPPALSSDGALVAVSNDSSTNLYEDGVLINVVGGRPLAWLDENRVLSDHGSGSQIYDKTTGTPTSPLFFPDLRQPRLLSASEIYTGLGNAIYSLASGDALWRCHPAFHGSIADETVVFVPTAARHLVLATEH
jgi:hypothetical protein